MRAVVGGLAGLAALVALVGLGYSVLPAAGSADAAEKVRLLGKVRPGEAPGFELRTAHGTFVVTPDAEAVRGRLEPFKLTDAEGGEALFVLGRRQEPVRDPNTQVQVPAQIVQIQAVVIADSDDLFEAPPLSKALAEKRLEWFSGHLKKTGSIFAIDAGGETNMQWGPARTIVRVVAEEADAGPPSRNAIVVAEGEASLEGRERRLAASRIYVAERGVPGSMLQLLSGG